MTPELHFDHIGIVVPALEEGRRKLSELLGELQWTRCFDDAGLGVSVVFARDRSGIVYELITPFGEKSPVAGALKSRTNLLNQIAYRTVSLDDSVASLRATRAVPVGRAAPAVAFGGARVQFLLTPLGFLVELIEIDRVVHQFL
jgi:methylmalonyl-CoA/ethylmalonyl-CoA epimerase